ncbi:hypothetical protein [Micromonospora fluostatini]|uniref:hypothetical protein n=1 Tax=Micromonospora sp. JCM 30529 TaxID=3421643 RepID=UPI003D17DD8C
MRRRLAALLAVPVVLVVAEGATSAVPALSRPSVSRAPLPDQSYWPGQEELMTAAEIVDMLGPRRWPDAYAGVSLDLPGGFLLVHRVPTAGVEAEVRAVVPRVAVRFVDAAYPAWRLDAWNDQIGAAVDWWQRRDVIIHGRYVRFGECVVVEVEYPARDAARLTARHRGVPLCVEQGYPSVFLTADP